MRGQEGAGGSKRENQGERGRGRASERASEEESEMSLIFSYGVAAVSRIDKIIGLFCKRDL